MPADHPLRGVKKLAERALGAISSELDALYSSTGRPSIPPERLLKGQLLIALYSIRSDRQFCEQLDYNILFRWFLDMDLGSTSLDQSHFSRLRERLVVTDIARRFFDEVVCLARRERPQPRNGPGEIADAANGFDDGLACLQPTGGLISLQPKPCEASAPLSWANGIVHRCSCQRSAQTGRRSVPFDQRRSAAALSFFPHVSLTVVSTMPWQPRSSRLQRGSPR